MNATCGQCKHKPAGLRCYFDGGKEARSGDAICGRFKLRREGGHKVQKQWTTGELRRLQRMYEDGAETTEMCAELERTRQSVQNKLYKLRKEGTIGRRRKPRGENEEVIS